MDTVLGVVGAIAMAVAFAAVVVTDPAHVRHGEPGTIIKPALKTRAISCGARAKPKARCFLVPGSPPQG